MLAKFLQRRWSGDEYLGRHGSTHQPWPEQDCVNCAIATDAMLAGRPASALPGGPHRIAILEQIFGAKFSTIGDLDEVVQALLAAGGGSRGIVYGSRSGGVGHVFNAVNQHGVIRFLDGQTGTAAVVSGYTGLRFLRTK